MATTFLTYSNNSSVNQLAAWCRVLDGEGWIIEALSDDFLEATKKDATGSFLAAVIVKQVKSDIEFQSEEIDEITGKSLMDMVLQELKLLTESESKVIYETFGQIALKKQSAEIEAEAIEFSFDFKPFKTHLVTTILIIINLLVYASMVIFGVDVMEPETYDIIYWGGNLRSLVHEGDYWRLITNIFVHIGLLHVALNMYALFYIGLILEKLIGSLRFALTYLVCGLLASVASLWWHVDVVSAGASGAIFGMYGFFLAMLLFKAVSPDVIRSFFASVILFVGYSLLMGFKGGIDNAAHFGGLIAGFVLGVSTMPSKQRAFLLNWQNQTYYVLAGFLLITGGVMYATVPKSNRVFETAFEKFSMFESEALAMNDFPLSTPKDSVIGHIRNVGIPSWDKGYTVINAMQDSDLSTREQRVKKQLLQYCSIRKHSFNLIIYNMNMEDNDSIKALEKLHDEIDQIIKSVQE